MRHPVYLLLDQKQKRAFVSVNNREESGFYAHTKFCQNEA